MLGWLRNVVLHRVPPPAEREDKAAHLDEAAREVQAQAAQIRRFRREARLAELRLRGER